MDNTYPDACGLKTPTKERFIRVINNLGDPRLEGKMRSLEEIDMEAIAKCLF